MRRGKAARKIPDQVKPRKSPGDGYLLTAVWDGRSRKRPADPLPRSSAGRLAGSTGFRTARRTMPRPVPATHRKRQVRRDRFFLSVKRKKRVRNIPQRKGMDRDWDPWRLRNAKTGEMAEIKPTESLIS